MCSEVASAAPARRASVVDTMLQRAISLGLDRGEGVGRLALSRRKDVE